MAFSDLFLKMVTGTLNHRQSMYNMHLVKPNKTKILTNVECRQALCSTEKQLKIWQQTSLVRPASKKYVFTNLTKVGLN